MPRANIISQELVRQLLDYDPDTGVLTWKYRTIDFFKDGKRFTKEHACAKWNTRYAGKIAGFKDKLGYIIICIYGKRYCAQRLAFVHVYGWLPVEVDHINNDGPKSDNRICNLRAATRSQNKYNVGMRSSNTSGHKGISFYARTNRYRVRIKVNKKEISLGYYKKIEDAINAYKEGLIKYHGDYGRVA